MRTATLCFAFGIWLCQQQAELPSSVHLAVLAGGVGSLLLVAGCVPRRLATVPTLIAMFLAGFLWAAWHGQRILVQRLSPLDEGRDIVVQGVVSGLPDEVERGRRFVFQVEQAEGARGRVPERISLVWYRQGLEGEAGAPYQEVSAGERWRLTVRLKRPHGNLNPGGFDLEAWLFERGIGATGYVRSARLSVSNSRLDAFVLRPSLVVQRLRETVRARFQAVMPDAPYGGILVALAVGDQQAIPPAQWSLFSRTGITHLMSISGLHVTLLAGLGGWLAGRLWRRRSALLLRLPAQKAAALGSVLVAYLYCLLAGFAVPAQRTLYMVAVVALALLSGRHLTGTRVLALALAVVLLLDPLAVVAPGFWLSFVAVGILFYAGAGRLAPHHWLKEWLLSQWAVTVGLLPALLVLFQQFSLISPVANMLAVPVITFVVTPLALLAVVLPVKALLLAAHAVLSGLMQSMTWLAALPIATWQQAQPPVWAVLLAFAGCGALLLPRGFPGRYWGACALLPLFFLPVGRPGPGAMRLTVLDVGEGLAVHIQTRHHDYLFDTGPQFTQDADSGNRIIQPYLRAVGVERLAGVIISHADSDHAGGAGSLLSAVPVAWVASSLPAGHALLPLFPRHLSCFSGQQWQEDGVTFRMLAPAESQLSGRSGKNNDLSCVLKISSSFGSILLTADTEKAGERALLAAYPHELKSDVMVVPHHGSKSSSSPPFVAAVAPDWAVIPVGYRNRFAHPRPEVLAQYRQQGAQILRTDWDGAVSLHFTAGGLQATRERRLRQRYWHDLPG